MTVDDVLEILNPLAAAAKLGAAAIAVYKWLKAQGTGGGSPDLRAALSRLPKDASAEDIVRVVTPFLSSAGGTVFLEAGSNGGGDVFATDAVIAGGNGTARGGDVVIKGGDGGPSGPGGSFTIVGGFIKGGDATGA